MSSGNRPAFGVLAALVVACTALPLQAFEPHGNGPMAQAAPGAVPADLPEMLIFLEPGTDPDVFAREHGLAVQYALRSDPDAYVFTAATVEAARTTRSNLSARADRRVRAAAVNQRTAYIKMFTPNDPYFHKNTPTSGWPGQWHLINEWTAGRDARVQGAWTREVTGSGVTIGLVDDCTETTHPDLQPNYVAADSWDFGQNDNTPNPVHTDDQHGVSTSGVACARGGNGIGVTGAAPYAGLAGLRIDFPAQTTAMFVDATLYHSSGSNTNIKVKNHSYGISAPYILTPEERSALVTSANAGTVHCFAAGNGRGSTSQDSNVMDLQSNPNCICVAAFGSDGKYASYSNFGACVAVTSPSSSATGYEITTTDRTTALGYNNSYGDTFPDLAYTSIFGGTSSATPLVAGVMALVKQVQPALNVRFAKHLLAMTSDIVDAADSTATSDGGWRTNAAGIHFNQNYGFGLIDADELTQVAEDYSGVTDLTTYDTGTVSVGAAIPDASSAGVTRTFNVSSATPLEEVEVRVVVSHSRNGDLEVYVTSPSGYTSRLTRNFSGSGGSNPLNWSFTTNALWGENPAGTWTVKVADVRSSYTGTWTSYRVVIHMGELIPSTGPTITQQPQPQNVCLGSTASFTVAASGTGTLTYQWQKDAANLTNGGRISGATSATLQISDVQTSDVASYRCVVTDSTGSRASNNAGLTLATTTITSHPSNQTVSQGGNASFTVAASGKGTLTYQWQMNGNNLTNGGRYSGATSATLQITGCTPCEQATYRCVATADCGSATSNGATLTINPPNVGCLVNPGFEDGFTSGVGNGWTKFTQVGSITCSASTDALTGSYSQMVYSSNNLNTGGVYQFMDTIPGQQYTVSMAVKTDNDTVMQGFLGVDPSGSTSWDNAPEGLRDMTTSLTWSRQYVTFTATGTRATVFLYAESTKAAVAGNVWFDDGTPVCSAPPPAPVISSAVSRKTHDTAGPFDIDVAATSAIESRKNGPTWLRVTFDKGIQQLCGTLQDVAASQGSVESLAVNGATLDIGLSGAFGPQTLTVSFPGIADATHTGAVVAQTLCFRVLYGDVNASGDVTSADLLAVRGQLNQPLGSGNFRSDTDANGTINSTDLLNVRSKLTTTAGTCP